MSRPRCMTDFRNQPSGTEPRRNVWRSVKPVVLNDMSGLTPTEVLENVAPGTVAAVLTKRRVSGFSPSSKTTRPLAVAPGDVITTMPATSSPPTTTGTDANSGVPDDDC